MVWIESTTTTSGWVERDGRDDRLELDLGQELDRRVDEAEPLRAQRDLLERLLARHVQRAPRGAEGRRRLQEQRRLADAGVAAQQQRRRRRRGRRRSRDRTRRGRLRCARSRAPSRSRAASPTSDGRPRSRSAPARAWRRFRRACSTRRTAGIAPATWAQRRRIRCSCRRSSLWPCTKRAECIAERRRAGEVVREREARKHDDDQDHATNGFQVAFHTLVAPAVVGVATRRAAGAMPPVNAAPNATSARSAARTRPGRRRRRRARRPRQGR